MTTTRRKAAHNVYTTTFQQAYWSRCHAESFAAADPDCAAQLAEYLAAGAAADCVAAATGLSEAEIKRIHAHGVIDALLRLSDEGAYGYREFYVVMQPAETPGEYDLASGLGDAPDDSQADKAYAFFHLVRDHALVNCYFAPVIAPLEALSVVQALAHEKLLGDYGGTIPDETPLSTEPDERG
jgi:hypothetical protein